MAVFSRATSGWMAQNEICRNRRQPEAALCSLQQRCSSTGSLLTGCSKPAEQPGYTFIHPPGDQKLISKVFLSVAGRAGCAERDAPGAKPTCLEATEPKKPSPRRLPLL